VFNYPPAYIPLAGERGSFSLLDIVPEDAKAFQDLIPNERQVGAFAVLRLIHSPPGTPRCFFDGVTLVVAVVCVGGGGERGATMHPTE